MHQFWAKMRAGLATRPEFFYSKHDAALCLFLMVFYVAAGRWGLTLALIQKNVTAIWLPSGIALATFLLLGYRVWPVVAVGAFISDIIYSHSIATAVGASAANLLEALVGCYLVIRFARGTKAFDTAEGVFKFVFHACIVSSAAGATAGAAVFYLLGLTTSNHFGYTWMTWCLADAVGILLIAPFLILLFGRPHHPLAGREFVELSVLSVGLIFTCLVVFGPLSQSLNRGQLIRASMSVPFLIWAGFRFCQLEAAGATLLLFGTAIWGTMDGVGYFATRNLNLSLLTLDMFIAVIGTMTLAVAALVAQRRETEANLLAIQSLLQDAVEGKSRDLEAAEEALRTNEAERIRGDRARRDSDDQLRRLVDKVPMVVRLLDPVAERILYVSPAYETDWGRSRESLYANTHSWLDAVHPEDQEIALNLFNRETKQDTLEAEYRIVRPDGTVRWIWDRGFVIRDDAGRISRMAGVASDITERRKQGKSFLTARGQKPENS